jgi:hypothetical protein
MANLETLDVMPELTNIAKFINIYKSPKLTKISGFNKITTIGESLSFHDLELLTELSGFQNTININKSFSLYNCFALKELNILKKLNKIQGAITIQDNNSLQRIKGFSLLKDMTNNTLTIKNNVNLTSIIGLANILANTFSGIEIKGNSKLDTCHIKSICDFVKVPANNSKIIIEANAASCTDINTVKLKCSVPVLTENYFDSQLINIFPMPIYDKLSINSPYQFVRYEVKDISGKLMSNSNLQPDNNISLGHLHSGLFILTLYDKSGRAFNTKIVRN